MYIVNASRGGVGLFCHPRKNSAMLRRGLAVWSEGCCQEAESFAASSRGEELSMRYLYIMGNRPVFTFLFALTYFREVGGSLRFVSQESSLESEPLK